MHAPPPRDLRKQALQKQALQHTIDPIIEDGVRDSLCLDDADAASTSTTHEQQEVEALPSWEENWTSCSRVEVPDRGTFNVYQAGTSGPVLLCLHGGGYTGLTWSLVAAALSHRYRVVAPDLRGHGLTTTLDDTDLSIQALSADVVALWCALFGGGAAAAAAAAAAAGQRTPIVLVGHSMGGAVAVHAAASKAITGLEGVVVVDVVEGTAIAALPHMQGILGSRPSAFPSPQQAVAWALRTGLAKNKRTAAISLPSQLRPRAPGGPWVWRTDLAASHRFWTGWYTGLSDLFLALPVPKLLLLAGTDRLDKALTIGQMQGRFQLVLMPTAGHAIQEDQPDKTAEHLAAFLHRFRVGEPPLQLPRAPPGTRPVLPVVAGPLHSPSRP